MSYFLTGGGVGGIEVVGSIEGVRGIDWCEINSVARRWRNSVESRE